MVFSEGWDGTDPTVMAGVRWCGLVAGRSPHLVPGAAAAGLHGLPGLVAHRRSRRHHRGNSGLRPQPILTQVPAWFSKVWPSWSVRVVGPSTLMKRSMLPEAVALTTA